MASAMKIGIDLRTAVESKAGKGWYTWHLVKELLRLDKKNEYVLYTNAVSGDLTIMRNAHIKLIHRHPVLWHTAVIKDWKKEMSSGQQGPATTERSAWRDRRSAHLFFAPTSYIIPALLPEKYPSIITVHDLVAFLHPKLHQFKATVIEKLLLKRALRRTKHVLVPSENTKKDLMRIFHYPEEKITVTPLGVDKIFVKETAAEPPRIAGTVPPHGGAEPPKIEEAIKKKYHLPEEFIFTVSGLEPRKNIGILIDAIANLRKKYTHLKLVIVGGKGWKAKKTEEKIAAAKDFVIHIQHIDTRDLPLLYRCAKIFVFPSLYEGFGLPPLEAMASGCPVICSNISSLPEVVGDAGLLFDPHNIEELKKNIETLLTHESLRQQCIKKGIEQAARFSWAETAKKTLAVFDSINAVSPL